MEGTPQENREEEPVIEPKNKKRRAKREYSIPKDAIRRLIREITLDRKSGVKFQEKALDTLHEMSENLLTGLFRKCSKLSKLCKTNTINENQLRFLCEGVFDSQTLLG